MPNNPVNNKIALVTGGGSGVGLASAKELSEKGFIVVLVGRRLDVLEQAVTEFPRERAFAYAADVVDPDSVAALFGFIENKFGRLDVLFNNAGVNSKAVSAEEIPFEEWKRVVDINLNGAFLCAQAAIKLMKKQQPMGGRIINNGSVSATTPRLYSAAYTATKHAITGLTKAIALDCRDFNIACGQIDIGNAVTSLSERMKKGVYQANGEIKPEAMMNVSSVAQAVGYMASLPLEANVLTMTVMATQMPFVGRG